MPIFENGEKKIDPPKIMAVMGHKETKILSSIKMQNNLAEMVTFNKKYLK